MVKSEGLAQAASAATPGGGSLKIRGVAWKGVPARRINVA